MKLTGLHWAVKRQNSKIVKLLLKYGSNVDAKDLINRTSLYIAASLNNVKILSILLL